VKIVVSFFIILDVRVSLRISRVENIVLVDVHLKHKEGINTGGMDILVRKCKTCNKILKRKEYETPSTFEKRMFCDKFCSNKWFRKHGHPWRKAVVIKRK